MNRADYLESPLLARAGFRHAFFTRLGGVSSGPFASLNFSIAVGDTAENVGQNLELACAALGIRRTALFYASQVHGRAVRPIEPVDAPERVLHDCADGLVTAEPGLACSVRTADCVPVLLGVPGTSFVAAVHAGWRGIVCDVIGASVAALRERGAGNARVLAAIGPHISRAAFEVSDEVAREIASSVGDPGVVDVTRGPKPHVDLRRAARARLRQAGLANADIDDVDGCTHSDAERFFSFRRDGRESGRHLSAIVAPVLAPVARGVY